MCAIYFFSCRSEQDLGSFETDGQQYRGEKVDEKLHTA